MRGGRLWPERPRSRGVLLGIAATLAALAAGGLLFAASGIYHVGASTGHWAITRALITIGLHSAVRTHSIGIEPPQDLDDRDRIRLGAGHFAGGCAPCHGAPGVEQNPILRGMLPPPPGLSHAVSDWETAELFWIVKHGLKYTAMPAWPALTRDDEVWSMVAFLERLPELSAEEYRELANFEAAEGSAAEPQGLATFSEALVTCARCHGDEDSPPTSRLVPRLSGQPVAYLRSALEAYAKGTRFSGVMRPVAAELDEDAIASLSAYYSVLRQSGEAPREATAAEEQIARGRDIATEGVPSEGVPPCLACHGEGASELFPRLEGQHAPYILAQLRAFKEDRRGVTTTGAIMKAIAERLAEGRMEDVAAYFESRPVRGQSGSGPSQGAAAPQEAEP